MKKIKTNYKLSSFDYETTGFSPYDGSEIFSYCIGWPIFNSNGDLIDCKVDVRRIDLSNKNTNKENFEYLKNYWYNTQIVKIIHNVKFEIHFTKAAKIEIPEDTIIHDTMIMSQLLRNLNPSHALDRLCEELCGYQRDLDKKVKLAGKALGNYQKIDKNLMRDYQVADGERPLLLYFTFIEQIKKDKALYKDYLNEIEVIKATQLEEERGILLHSNNIEKLTKWLNKKLNKIPTDVYNLIGEWVNLNSPDQLTRLLYRKLGFDILKFTDSTFPKPSTDKDTIFDLMDKYKDHDKAEIFNLILKQRSYTKALASIESYLKLSDDNLILHPNLNTNFAKTGRKSSSKPNLQNVSRESGLKNLFPVPLRKCFRPRRGYVIIPVDYSGIEMRLIVEHSKEPELITMLKKDPDADLHHLTLECFLMDDKFINKNDKIYKSGIINAKNLKETDLKKYKVHRGGYKNTGFGIAYGGGKERISITLMKSIEEIDIGFDNYCKRFQCIANFTHTQMEQVRKHGYIVTSFGRKLYVPRDKAYIGSNYLIQGTAAGIHKRGQVKVQKLLSSRKMYKDIHIILDVHDELMLEYPRKLLKYKDEILPEINRVMINMKEIEVPLRAEFSICTTSWNDKVDLEVLGI